MQQYLRLKQTRVTIIIDVFRAFTTASYILEKNPTIYVLTTKSPTISRLASNLSNSVFIGKPEKKATLAYNIPNSPARTQEIKITGKHVFHRTEAGAKGIILAKNSDIILAAGFVNAYATVQHIKTLQNPKVTIVPMGHEGSTPTLEDDVCATYIKNLIYNKKTDLISFIPSIRNGTGKYFFSEDQWQYPKEDFELCLKTNRFTFAIQATVHRDYAILTRCDINPLKKTYVVQSAVIQQGGF